MTLALTPPAWVAEAACASVDPQLFTPEDTDALAAYRHARLICATCPVQRQCLETALANNERYGMWGGLTPSERQKLQRPERDPGFCTNGHSIAEVGRHVSGYCMQCRRDRQARYDQRRREGRVAS